MKKRKLIGLSLTALAVATVAAIGITSINSDLVHALFNRNASQTIYYLTLDSSNKVTSAGDKVQKTASNNNVTFTYSSVNSDTSGHVTLNDGGYLVNKDWMRSITSFTCTFASGALNVKSSFGGNVWNDGFSIESGHKYELGSNPYYLKFTASGSALINSIVFEMSCIENPAAHEGDESGEDVIYYQKVHSGQDVQARQVRLRSDPHAGGDGHPLCNAHLPEPQHTVLGHPQETVRIGWGDRDRGDDGIFHDQDVHQRREARDEGDDRG